MDTIKDTVVNIMQRLEAKKTGVCDDPWALLKKVLTKKERQHIKLNYFRKGVLNLCVDSSSWLYALSLKKDDLLFKLNKESCAIKNIRFRIGEIK